MVYCYITLDMKKQALQMPDEGLEMEDIADVLAVSARSILQWEAKYEDYGQVDPPFSLQAYWHLLNGAAFEDLQELINEEPSLFLNGRAECLALYHQQLISRTCKILGWHTWYKKLLKAAAENDNAYCTNLKYEITTDYTAKSSKDGHSLYCQCATTRGNSGIGHGAWLWHSV